MGWLWIKGEFYLCILNLHPFEEKAEANIIMICGELPVEALSILQYIQYIRK